MPPVDDVTRDRWEQSLRALRRKADDAGMAWRRAGGYWPPAGTPSHPALFAVARDARDGYYAAAAECYPPDVDALLQRLRADDSSAVDEAIEWLEADYFTRGTGYIKQKLLFQLCRVHMTDADRERLRAVVLGVCTRGPRKEFREVRRLARRQLASSDFAARLRLLADSAEPQRARDAALLVLSSVESVL
jgi:hypothetical protein